MNTGEQPLFNDATRVLLMRSGLRTVMSVQNDYRGPLEDFALVVPVPIVLEKENVRTLPPSIFDRVDKLSAPRLVEYWEQDPCGRDADDGRMEGGGGTRAKGEEGSMGNPNTRPLVKVEREFSVDEYDIVVLSALDSGALETWLRGNNYKIPAGAEPYLRPYVQEGSKFFVAKVDIGRVHFRWNRAQLSPLRFHFDTPEFKLPIRLGLINSSGQQDLLVYILGEERYETANYPNVFIPTNLGVKDDVRSRFNSFYAGLYDRTLAQNPKSVVTEYSWTPQSCDPCPVGAGPLATDDSELVGLDVVQPRPSRLVLTRLHARYGKDVMGEDLVFKTGTPVVGGREYREEGGTLSTVAKPAQTNAFQGRYIVRHPWQGGITCRRPQFGSWGDPPDGVRPTPPKPNPHADRQVNPDDFLVDERAASDGSRGGVLGLLQRIVDVHHWNTLDIAYFSLVAFPIGLAAALYWSWRRRLGVSEAGKTALVYFGLPIAFLVLAGVCGMHGSRPARMVLTDPLLMMALAIAIPGIAAGRTWRRALWAFAPVLAGFAYGFITHRRGEEVLREELAGAGLSRLARAFADLTEEEIEPIVAGAMLTAFCAVFATLLTHTKRPAMTWRYAPAALVVATAARYFLLDRFLRSPQELMAIVILAAAFVIAARAESWSSLVIAATAVALVDVSGQLFTVTSGVGPLGGESIDPSQAVRLLSAAIRDERRHLVLSALDLGLFAGVVALGKPKLGAIDGRLPIAAAFLVLFCATPFEWLGHRERFASLDMEGARNAALAGPALFVENNALLASPRADIPPAPYTAKLAESMAKEDSGESPLLFVRDEGGRPLSALLDTLSPLLRGHQSDYRLMARRSAPPELGIYGGLIVARDVEPTAVDFVVPAIDRHLVTFVLHGERLEVRADHGDGLQLSLARDDAAANKLKDDLRYRESRRHPAMLLVPRETSLVDFARCLELITDVLGFPRVMVSTDPR